MQNSTDRTGWFYEIRVQGWLDKNWSHWMDDVSLVYEKGEQENERITVLQKPAADQAVLRGVLNKLFDLNVTILSIQRFPMDEEETFHARSV